MYNKHVHIPDLSGDPMSQVVKLIILVLGTAIILWVSWPSLRKPFSRGFYRTFVFESILIMFLLAVDSWFADPLSLRQIISWMFLTVSGVLILSGVWMFSNKGKIDPDRQDPTLVGIEKTTVLVTTGIYYYIRHPFYSSLLFLAWGVLFKDLTWIAIFLTAGITILLVIIAKKEEIENLQYFGESYRAYMRGTKMFIPYLV